MPPALASARPDRPHNAFSSGHCTEEAKSWSGAHLDCRWDGRSAPETLCRWRACSGKSYQKAPHPLPPGSSSSCVSKRHCTAEQQDKCQCWMSHIEQVQNDAIPRTSCQCRRAEAWSQSGSTYTRSGSRRSAKYRPHPLTARLFVSPGHAVARIGR